MPLPDRLREAAIGEIHYEREFFKRLGFGIGLRRDQEVINYEQTTFLTNRNILLADITYYFDTFKEFNNSQIYGTSNTTSIALEQSGSVGILPAVKLGLALPLDGDWVFLLEGAFESLQTVETRADGTDQTTTQTNLKTGLGLRRYF
jgi:hypothetical protein